MTADYKDKEGNTFLHLYLLEETSTEGIDFFLENGVRLTRNNKGQSALHIAAKHHPLIFQAIDILLKYGAEVTEIDNQGSSVLHEVLKNSSVTLEVIERLLKLGAHPDFRDIAGKPPLAYCDCSSLQPEEKKLAEKMIIQHSIVRKMKELIDAQYNFDESESLGDTILCFNFLQDCRKLNEWGNFRDLCITEILKMKNVILDELDEFTLFDFLHQVFADDCKYEYELSAVLNEFIRNEYPNFRDSLLSELGSI